MRKDAMLVETLQSQAHVHPHTLAQPFLGFIRKHEKIYAREIGLMRIALREFKGIYDHIKAHLDNSLSMACNANIAPTMLQSLLKLQQLLVDGAWVFDSRFFIRKVQMNPLEDPIDVATQANIITSYQEDFRDNESEIAAAKTSGDSEKAALLGEVQDEMKVLLNDLNTRAREKGGWRALLYTSNGTLDMNMPLHPWTPQEQVLILQEKLRHVQAKSAEKEREHAAIVKQLQDTMDQAHQRDHHGHHHHSSNHKAPRSHHPHPGHHNNNNINSIHKNTTPAGRSMSVSGGSSSSSSAPLVLNQKSAAVGHNNQYDGYATAPAPVAPAPHRHTLAYVGKTPCLAGIAVSKEVPPSTNVNALLMTDEIPPNEGISAVKAGKSYIATQEAQTTLPAEFSASIKQVMETLSTADATLNAANQQQEQQQHFIVELQALVRHQQQMLRQHGHRSEAPHDALHDNPVLFGSVDGESSVLSQPSQEIIDEYKQTAAGSTTPKIAATHHGVKLATLQKSASHGSKLTTHEVAAGTVGFSGVGFGAGVGGTGDHKRRGSVLVQHRDSGQIEYVPIGKMANSQAALRITVNNELRSHKHLLVRPASASASATSAAAGFSASSVGSPVKTAKKTFASIMSAGVGSKAPLDKYRQYETEQRREKALKVSHDGVQPPPALSINTSPLVTASGKSELSLRVPSMEPPSPKKVRKLSSNTLAHELSTIIDSIEGISVESSTHQLPPQSSDEKKAEGAAVPSQSAESCNTSTLLPQFGGTSISFDGSPESLVKTLNVLCSKLQDSLVVHGASLKIGQEIMAGDHDAPPAETDLLRSDYLPNDLHIGELAIDEEKEKPFPDRHNLPKAQDTRYMLSASLSTQNNGSLQRRPKTAGDAASSSDSYEDIFRGMLAPPTATQMHSDVSIYATTLQNRYNHHVQEAKKIEAAIKKLGKTSEQEDLEHQQEVAQTMYASSSIFRPQSAAPTTAPFSTAGSSSNTNAPKAGKSQRSQQGNRAQSASAASPGHGGSAPPPGRKNRGVTAVPFAKIHLDSVNSIINADVDNNSVSSPRLNEMSAELSNLSEHEVPVINFRS